MLPDTIVQSVLLHEELALILDSSLSACFTLHRRNDDFDILQEEGWTIGLLTKPPTPEGDSYKEVDQPTYERKEISFAQARSVDRQAVGLSEIIFTDLDMSKVRHAGLFDPRGELAAYGVLTGKFTDQIDGVCLGVGMIRIRRLV